MKWYDKLLYRINNFRGASDIAELEGSSKDSSQYKAFFENSYNNIEVVRRGVDMIVDGCADVNVSINSRLKGVLPRTAVIDEFGKVKKNTFIRQNTLQTILTFSPNPLDDINQHRRLVYMDLVLCGNSYEYFDGINVYHLPAVLMEVKVDSYKKVQKYILNGKTEFQPHEIIHTRDNSGNSTIVGTSRLRSTLFSIKILKKMLDFQDAFFENGAVPGLIITTPNALGQRIKDKMIQQWQRDFGPAKQGKRPMILDADLKPHPLSVTSFKELDFAVSVAAIENKILKVLGIPPILMEGGNNANIRPNLRMFFETTVLPLTAKHMSAYKAFFGYDLEPDVAHIIALRPELRDASAYYIGLVNSGIITVNESRKELRYEASTEEHADKLRIPANITGSATNPSEGGRPPDGSEDEEEESSAE